ncbi:MAG: RNA polymerase sigma factor [Planctomycetota bacterium]
MRARRALAEGSSAAFGELYDRHAGWMLAAARAITRSVPDAEDAVHETFLGLHRQRSELVGVREVRAYLRTALRRVAVRVRERRAEHAPVDVELLASEHEVVERDPELEVALARLPEDQREVLALKTEGELTFEEIGLVLGIPANTAASRYRYALEKLRAALGGTR